MLPRVRRPLSLGLLACSLLAACDDAPADGLDAATPADAGARPTDARPGDTDAGPAPAGHPTLVAIGKMGRITTSCDGGETWAHDASDDDGASCVGIDCDHHRGSSTGLTWGGGAFWASFGWGEPAMRIRRSADGVTWDTLYDSPALHFAGLAWAGDRLAGATTQPHTSTDGVTWDGAEWPEWDVPEGEWPVGRQVGWAPVDGGRLIVVSGAGNLAWGAVIVSRDGGATFSAAEVDEGCRGVSRPPVFGGGAWVIPWGVTGVVCASLDGGDRWTAQTIADGEELSNAVFTGTEHVVYAGARRFASADGTTWSESASDAAIGVVGFDPTREVYVAVERGGAYEAQRFLRSADGMTWDALPDGAFTPSHPITHLVFGWGMGSGCAP